MAKSLSVRELIAERERQERIVESAKSARVSIDLLNKLIAQYGTEEASNGDGEIVTDEIPCEFFDKTFTTRQGKNSHITRTHKKEQKT